MAVFPLQDNLDIRAPKLIDQRSGPYPSIAAALHAVKPYQRKEGLIVFIKDGSSVKEYWWDSDDLTDSGIKEKPSGGGTPVADQILAASPKETPADADVFGYVDAASSGLRKFTWANIKSVLKAYFDGIYKIVFRDKNNDALPYRENATGGGFIEYADDYVNSAVKVDIKPEKLEATDEIETEEIQLDETEEVVTEPFLNPDWDETDESSIAFIRNKPSIGGGGIIDLLYSELMIMIGLEVLEIGQSYRITDYQTTYYNEIAETVMSGAVEELIVKAETNKTLSPIAFSEAYPEDIIFYTTDNYHESEKGWILRRIDTKFNNDIQFDFRGMYFRRWKVISPDLSFLYGGYCGLYPFESELTHVTITVDEEDYIDIPVFIPSESVKGNTIKTPYWMEVVPDITIGNNSYATNNYIVFEEKVVMGRSLENVLNLGFNITLGDYISFNELAGKSSLILSHMTRNRACVIDDSYIMNNFGFNTSIYINDSKILDNFISNTSVGIIQKIQPTSLSKVYKDISVNFPYTTEIIRTINDTYRVKYYDANGDTQTEPI